VKARLTPRAARSATVLLLALLCLLAGCGGDTAKSPRAKAAGDAPEKALTAGTCWGSERLPDALGAKDFATWIEKYADGDTALGDSMHDDAAFEDKVDCDKAHSVELYNVVSLGPALAGKVTKYADLLDQTTPLFHRISDEVNNRCLAGSAYDVPPRTKGGLAVQLSPYLNTDGGVHVAWDPFPADLWAAGQHQFVCLFATDEPGTLRFADLTTSRTPVAARVCLNTPASYVPCTGRHQAENIAELGVNTAVEKGQLSGRNAVRKGPKGPYVAISDAAYARLDRVCQTFLSSVSTVRGGVVGRAYLGTPALWPNDEGKYVASCFAVKPLDPPPPFTGTVFDR
jgi:hypothetical protein